MDDEYRKYMKSNRAKDRYDSDPEFRERVKMSARERYWNNKKEKKVKENFLDIDNGHETIRVFSRKYTAAEVGVSLSTFRRWFIEQIIPTYSYRCSNGKDWYSDDYIYRLGTLHKRFNKYCKNNSLQSFKAYLLRMWGTFDELADPTEGEKKRKLVYTEELRGIHPPKNFRRRDAVVEGNTNSSESTDEDK